MFAAYLTKQAGPAGRGARISRAVPMPGVVVYDCELAAPPDGPPEKLLPGHCEVLFCRLGRMEIVLADGRTLAAGPGEMFLVTDTAEINRISLPFGPFSGLVTSVDRQAAQAIFSRLHDLLSNAPLDTARLRALMGAHNGCMPVCDALWGASVLAALGHLPPEQRCPYWALKLLEQLYLLCSAPAADTLGPETRYYDRYQTESVRRVHDYMLAHLEQPLTIQALSTRFQLSPTFLKTCFRQMYGEPIHAYVQRYRLHLAAHRLCTTQASVLSIAASVGYAGTSRFGVAFKKLYHMTPAQYRRKNVQKR